MKLFCISDYPQSSQQTQIINSLKQVCKDKDITFVKKNINNYDRLRDRIKEKSILYRSGISQAAKDIEKNLINSHTATFYISGKNYGDIDNVTQASIIHQKNNIPIPKTVFAATTDRNTLRKKIGYLGGFPVIIKIAQGQKGIGVILTESFPSLFSMVDYLAANNTDFVIREFIKVKPPIHSYRAIVLGNRVEFAYKNISLDKDDFRSNVNQEQRKREKIELKQKEKDILVKSVRLLNYETGAVDFIYGKDKSLKILEVNFPFNFVPVVKDLKYPIDEKMVDYLISKSKSLS
jgi:glutathione synthase/RimK-type ligase-like ATP-grasp enzyme